MMAYLVVFIITSVISVVYTLYLKHVNAGNAVKASFSDMVLITLGLTTYQIWADKGNDKFVFITEIFGSGLGTYITVKYFKKRVK